MAAQTVDELINEILANSQPQVASIARPTIENAVSQGLNLGIPQIRDYQVNNNIRIPQTPEEVAAAKAGTFNQGNNNGGSQIPMLTGQAQQQVGTNPWGQALSDFFGGYKDNRYNGFDSTNLLQDPQKSKFFKAGELFGTLGRIAQNPIVQGATVAGIAKATGSSTGKALRGGFEWGVNKAKQNTEDALYRRQLEDLGVDTSNITGYVDKDMYKNTAESVEKKLKREQDLQIFAATDNRERAKMLIKMHEDGQLTDEGLRIAMRDYGILPDDLPKNYLDASNATKTVQLNKDRLAFDKVKHSQDLALHYAQLNEEKGHNRVTEKQGWARIQQKDEQFNKNLEFKMNKGNKDIQTNNKAVKTIDNVIKLIKENPNAIGTLYKGYASGQKGWLSNDLNKKSTVGEIKTRSGISDLSSIVIKNRSGAAVTASEFERLTPFLPTPYDTPKTAIAKLEQMKERINSETQEYINNFNTTPVNSNYREDDDGGLIYD